MNSKNRAFTLIELLVVVSIISLLASVVMASLNTARSKARDAERMADLKQIQAALELYRNDNGSYPSTGFTWWSTWGFGGVTKTNSGPGGYIPNLAPTYISVLPSDPKTNGSNGYLYISNGTDYMMLAWLTAENPVPIGFQRPRYSENSFAIYSPGYNSACTTGCP